MDPATAIVIVVAYLLGSVGFGVIVPRTRGIDIYSVGSGNPGTSNVYRNLGSKAAAAVLVGDLAKGLVGAAIGAVAVSSTVGWACGFAAVVGHIFPLWHRFRGGRGVATGLGAAMWLAPLWGAVLVVVWGGVVAATKTASMASILVMVALVPGLVVAGRTASELAWATAIAGAVLARHAPNIRRLVRGEERSVVGES